MRDPRQLPARDRIEEVVDALHEPLQPFALVAMWSGLRLFEVAALEPRDLERRDGVWQLHVRHGKGGRERWSVLFEPGLNALQEAIAAQRPYQRLIVTNARGGAWDRRSVEKHWTRARRAVGMPVDDSSNFHFLTRHFHATWLLDRGASDMDCAVQLGHLTRDGRPNTDLVRRVYGHPDLQVALGRVAAVAA